MTYPVIVTQRAKSDLRHYFAVAAEHAPETAARWLNRFEEALQTLSTNPIAAWVARVDVEAVDEIWCDRFPPALGARLRELVESMERER